MLQIKNTRIFLIIMISIFDCSIIIFSTYLAFTSLSYKSVTHSPILDNDYHRLFHFVR